MTTKTLMQINRMKTQTFGVEIEMNHISRETAAQVAAHYFGTDNWKSTAHIHGYSAVSAWDNEGREWKMVDDLSIDGDTSQRCELVTPILYYSDIELLQGLCRELRRAGAISNPDERCGIHIHIGADGHNAKTLRNLVNLMASHENLLAEAIFIDDYRMGEYCKVVNRNFLTLLNKKKPKTMAKLGELWYDSQGETRTRYQHYNRTRYHMINLHSVFTKSTIEFRLFQFDNRTRERRGGIHAGQLKSYIQFCLAISQMAKDIKFASYTPPQEGSAIQNPKFAMRTWLNRLGLIGEEFKTVRMFLTRRLDGSSAFRFENAA